MYGPGWGSFHQRILCPVKVTSFQSSEPTLKSFLSLVRTRCSVSCPPVPKRSSTKRLMIPATDFPAAGLPAMGSSTFSNAASISDLSRDTVRTLLVPCSCAMVLSLQGSKVRTRDCVEYSTKQHGSPRVGTMQKLHSALSRMFPPASGRHRSCHLQVSSIWQQCTEEDLLLVATDKQHHGSHHETVLEGRLSRDQCEKDPNFCWLPSGNSSEIRVFWNQGKRSVDSLSACPGNLTMSSLCLEEVALLFRHDGEHPSSGHIVLWFHLPRVDEIKNLIVNRGFVLKMFRLSKLFVVSSYFLG